MPISNSIRTQINIRHTNIKKRSPNQPNAKPFRKQHLGLLITTALISQSLLAADFTITGAETTAQTLSIGETGIITATGSLSTAGVDAIIAADSTTITNNGSIATTGNYSHGVEASSNATITNSGSVVTSGYASNGIVAEDNATVTNSGSIVIIGRYANGIEAGRDATITNSGSIAISGRYADGILADSNVTITNSGSIVTNGRYSDGIDAGNDATITNSSSIVTNGRYSDGINADSYATITNNGSAMTSGDNSTAIEASSNATITNSGSAVTSGDNSNAIRADINATITNNGSIIVTGSSANGISLTGTNDNSTLNNSGVISATGAGSFAILNGTSSATTLNLFPGSHIIGAIDLGGNAAADGAYFDTVNIHGGANISSTITFQNTEVVNLVGGATGLAVTSGADITATVVDTTGESNRGVALSSLTTGIHNIIKQRSGYELPLENVKVASLELSSEMLFSERKPVAWLKPFSGSLERDSDGNSLAYTHNQTGLAFGYEQDFDRVRVGFLGGYARTNTNTDISSFDSKGDNYIVGAYSHYKVNGIGITTALIGGYSEHDNHRNVVDNLQGAETAKSDFNSVFISPSLTIATAYKVSNNVELRPSASATYSMAWLDGYKESGTTRSDLKIGSRNAKALNARVELAGAYSFNNLSEVALRLGMNARNTDDDNTRASLGVTPLNFRNSGDQNVTGDFAGIHFESSTSNQLNIVADFEVGGADKETYTYGYIGLEYLF